MLWVSFRTFIQRVIFCNSGSEVHFLKRRGTASFSFHSFIHSKIRLLQLTLRHFENERLEATATSEVRSKFPMRTRFISTVNNPSHHHRIYVVSTLQTICVRISVYENVNYRNFTYY